MIPGTSATVICEASNDSYQYKSLVKNSSGMHVTLFVNVTQMPAVLVHPSPVM